MHPNEQDKHRVWIHRNLPNLRGGDRTHLREDPINAGQEGRSRLQGREEVLSNTHMYNTPLSVCGES